MLEILEASIKLGIPMAVLSCMLFRWLHSEGKLDIGADRKTIASDLKQIKKSQKEERRAAAKAPKKKTKHASFKSRLSHIFQFDNPVQNDASDKANFLFDRWMWFGSGFYGLAALWTLVVLETVDVLRFIFAFPGFDVIFANGIVGAIIDFFVNQLGNFVSAFLWFTYWGNDSVVVWILVAYLGYFAGTGIAKRVVKNDN